MRRDCRRLAMFGFDAISLPFVTQHIDDLPFFASLSEHAVFRPLATTATYLSDSVWPSFALGRDPGFHGQYFPMQWDAPNQRFRRISDRKWSRSLGFPPFWHGLARAGVETVTLDVPHVLHDEDAPCLQISNWSYQGSGKARASQIDALLDIRRRFGRRPIGPEVPVPKTKVQCDEIRDRMIAAIRLKTDAVLHLMDRPWQLLIAAFFEIHRAGHNLWPTSGDFASAAAPDALLDVYVEADRQLARLLNRMASIEGEPSLLLFALHGMAANRVQDHFLTEVIHRLNQVYCGSSFDRGATVRPRNLFAALRGRLPYTLQYRLAELLGEDVQDWVVNRALTGGWRWRSTPAFPLISGGEGLIRFNVKGRERDGFFEPDSAELRDFAGWLRERLLEIRVVPSGEALIADIVSVDDLYRGPRRDGLPDLVLRWNPDEPAEHIASAAIGDIRTRLETGRGGNHTDDAFVFAVGDVASLLDRTKSASITDFAPLAFEFLGAEGNPAEAR